jgi:hypothetical protein
MVDRAAAFGYFPFDRGKSSRIPRNSLGPSACTRTVSLRTKVSVSGKSNSVRGDKGKNILEKICRDAGCGKAHANKSANWALITGWPGNLFGSRGGAGRARNCKREIMSLPLSSALIFPGRSNRLAAAFRLTSRLRRALQQGKTDISSCNANLDVGTPNASATACMAQKGYALVRRDQAEDVRAAYAAGSQRPVQAGDR